MAIYTVHNISNFAIKMFLKFVKKKWTYFLLLLGVKETMKSGIFFLYFGEAG